jgi:hypothetical protein
MLFCHEFGHGFGGELGVEFSKQKIQEGAIK